MNYRDTLHLPQTDFPMKADLVKKEPDQLQRWEDQKLYQARLKQNAGGPKFILHDGPPYANGNIHFGHILNKTLKDMIVRYRSMKGNYAPYVPGWDCHGLPIEHQVDKTLGAKKKDMTRVQVRQACRDYAMKFVDQQRDEFKRLGIMADWENPYLTLTHDYEATIAREFGRFVRSGHVYNALRPVMWCPNCRTALADAEMEYEEKKSPSVFVRFPLKQDAAFQELFPKAVGKDVSVVIWTTTPWTLPANLGVAVHASFDYALMAIAPDTYIVMAKQLAKSLADKLDEATAKLLNEEEPLYRVSGKKLEGLTANHPFLSREVPVLLSDHVTIDTGTGCVHIAPGHGDEDYDVGRKYGLAILSPVDHTGRYTPEVGIPEWEKLKAFDANPLVIDLLKQKNRLLHQETITHMFPHCWRCKNPLMSRATEQYFLSLSHDDLRAKALDAIRRVKWIPHWGRERIYGMVEKRNDWCLSRQRSWGVPIISFRCTSCQKIHLDADWIDKISDRFDEVGSDLWYDDAQLESLLPPYACPHCQQKSWAREEHILDVWFDSGVSHAAVLEKRPDLQSPADLYLEGSDQHRGWFHSSLLTSVGTRNRPPYQTVLTHGFVVDSQGKKYSKSAGNYVPPEKVIQENGAEILRLWVAAEDYRNDIRVSKEILTRLVEAYRKIRNTCRFLLGNLFDFDPQKYPLESVLEFGTGLDHWALHQLQKLTSRVEKAYEEYNFHVIFHDINRFCTVELSAFYLDILKDRLYTASANDKQRKASQRILFEIATTLSRLMAPIMVFTSEEIWQHLPSFEGKTTSVHLAPFPTSQTVYMDEGMASRWDEFRELRDEFLKVLEQARAKKLIGNSLEAKITIIAEAGPEQTLAHFKDSLNDLLQVSEVDWGTNLTDDYTRSEKYPTLFMKVSKAAGEKCERCWRWSTQVGKHPAHPTLCTRCHDVIEAVEVS